jgi:hypothetical protein
MTGFRTDNVWVSLLKGGATRRHRDSLAEAVKEMIRRSTKTRPPTVTQGSPLASLIGALQGEGLVVNPYMLETSFSSELTAELRELNVDFKCADGVTRLGSGSPHNPPAIDRPVYGYYKTGDLLSLPSIQRLLHTEMIHAVPFLYFGCLPIVSTVTAWWSYPTSSHAEGAQFFHQDRADFNSLNLFTYLTDVNEESGAHVFCKCSHRLDFLESVAKDLPSDTDREAFWEWLEALRKSDSDVARFFPSTVIKGPAGTSFFEDTNGYHKAMVPTKDRRLVFSVIWTLIPQFNSELRPILIRPPVELAPNSWLRYVNQLAYSYE